MPSAMFHTRMRPQLCEVTARPGANGSGRIVATGERESSRPAICSSRESKFQTLIGDGVSFKYDSAATIPAAASREGPRNAIARNSAEGDSGLTWRTSAPSCTFHAQRDPCRSIAATYRSGLVIHEDARFQKRVQHYIVAAVPIIKSMLAALKAMC